jgi:hypothetical protein
MISQEASHTPWAESEVLYRKSGEIGHENLLTIKKVGS